MLQVNVGAGTRDMISVQEKLREQENLSEQSREEAGGHRGAPQHSGQEAHGTGAEGRGRKQPAQPRYDMPHN